MPYIWPRLAPEEVAEVVEVVMKFRVSKVGSEGLHKEYDLGAGWFESALGEARLQDSPASGKAVVDVQVAGSKVTVTGRVVGRFDVPCSRCLEAAEVEVDSDILLVLDPRGPTAEVEEDEEVELTEEDLHYSTYEGDEIDLAPLIREQFVLAIPIAPLCRPDCWPESFSGVVAEAADGGEQQGSSALQEERAQWKDKLAKLRDELAGD